MLEDKHMKQTINSPFKLRKSIDGIHLFNRETGLNVLLDEIAPPRETWTNSPRQVSIALTNRCNLSCPHCYAPQNEAELPVANVKQWMKELDSIGCFGIGFGGGEPLLYPYLAELCEFGQQTTKLAVTLTTNGLLLTNDILAKLQHNVNFIRISMDGVDATYEQIRNSPFKIILERIECVSKTIPFGINYVVNRKTINDLDKAIEVAEKYHATEFLVLPEEAAGRGKKIDDETLTGLLYWIKTYKGKVRLAISADYQDYIESINPLPNEHAELSYAHISADCLLKKTSFSTSGIPIKKEGFLAAFNRLKDEMENIL